MNSKRRLDKIEKNIRVDNLSGRRFVGRYYDELTEEERYLWLKYLDSLISPDQEPSVEAFEQIQSYFSQGLHFICGDRQKPATQAELRERIQEIEDYMNERKRTDKRLKEEKR